ncbi:unnamed protein product [Plutella xylostella]|uniref:(diamondback moth) hypothetical protein n=1 Tax=Plutella xylostella TaxID=51655 RepID=A0A8S4FG11_PLUXY|nr:unnamed protein product [Plutella xylostella]
MLWLLLAASLALWWAGWRVRHRRLLALGGALPGPAALPGLGNAWKFMCKPEHLVKVIQDLSVEYGDVMRFWLGPDLNVVVSDPGYLRTLMNGNKISVKGQQYKYMSDVLGKGILSGSGPVWRKHRKIATPNYSKRAIDSYEAFFNHEAAEMLVRLRERDGETLNMHEEVVRATSYVACQTLMGLTKEQTSNLPHFHYLIEKSQRMYDIVFFRMTTWWLQIDPVFWLTSYYRDQKTFVSRMMEFCGAILDLRTQALRDLGKEKIEKLMGTEDDLPSNTELSVIDRFLLSKELSWEEMCHETFTVFTSSQEATAKIASFLLLMMAQHPDCQEKLYAEITSIMGEQDRDIYDEDLKRMEYLELVFREVIRLFPIGVLLQRTVTEDIELGSVTLPSGCSLVVPIYSLHRDSRFWRHPEDFDPERFTPENSKGRHPYCYIPFSMGPMDCLGRHFAIKVVKTVCVRILREFHLSSPERYADLQVYFSISAVPLKGFPVTLTRRKCL